MSNSLALIEFDLSGKVLSANDNFYRIMGYELREIAGRHHSMFAETAYAESSDYAAF